MSADGTILKVSVRLGNSNFKDLSFSCACNMIKGYLEADQYGLKDFTKLEKNSAICWISEVFASSPLKGKWINPPVLGDWDYPIWEIKFAKKRYNCKDYESAERHLKGAANSYNRLHKQWINYLNAVKGGSEIAIITLEATVTLCQASIAVMSGGQSAIVTAGIGALSVGVAEASKKSSRYFVFDEKELFTVNNFTDVGSQMVEAFATSLVGGAISGRFFKTFVLRFNKYARADPRLAKEAFERGIFFGSAFKAKKFYELPAEVLSGVISTASINALKQVIFQYLKINQGKNINKTASLDGIADLFWKTNREEAFKLLLKIMKK